MRMLQEAVPLHSAAAEEAARQGGPTAVPRNAGVADGPWSTTDASLVAEAIANDVPTPRIRKTKRFAEHGARRDIALIVGRYLCWHVAPRLQCVACPFICHDDRLPSIQH